MVKFKIGTTTGRYEVVAQDTDTLADVVTAQGLSTSGVTFHINGVPASSIDKTVQELNITDGSMVMVVPAQKAGRS